MQKLWPPLSRRHALPHPPWPAQIGVLALAACIAGSFPARADELRTHSGETLIGKVIEEQPDLVVFESSAFGRMSVPRKAIASLTFKPEPAPPLEAQPLPEEKQAAEEAKTEQAAAQAQAERQAELSTDAVGRFLARINPLKGWKTRLGLGFIARRGSDDNDNDLTVRFQSERKTDAGDEHRLEARYYYAEDVLTDGTQSATDQLLTGSYRYRHPLTDPLFFQAVSEYYSDAIKQLDHEVTQTFGVGGRAKGERWTLAFTPAGGVRWRQVDGEDDTHAVVGFYQEAGLNITQTLKLAETLDYLVAVDDSSDYTARLGVDLNQKLGGAWSLGLRYEYNYDSVVGKDQTEDQVRFTINVGLEF
jgi:hypothetical protein